MGLVEAGSTAALATLTLNRPESRNALSTRLCAALTDELGGIDASGTARAVVIRGAGPVFCSGADLADVEGGGVEFIAAFEEMLEALARHPLPTVAAIRGAALGGGLQLACVCDFRIVASDARLGIPSSRLGVVVNFENVQRLVDLAGVALAKEVLMAGRMLGGEEASARGLATKVVPEAEVDAAAEEYAGTIASLAPQSVQGAKRAIQGTLDARAARRLDPAAVTKIDALVARAYASEDLQEGIRAAAEKRPPRFTGR